MDNVLNKLTSNEIMNDKNILDYENYEINCADEPNTIGIATHYFNGRLIWYIYEIDEFKIKTIIQDHYTSFKKVLIDTKEYILGKNLLNKWLNAKLEEKRKARLEEKNRIDKLINDYKKEYYKNKKI